MKNIIFYLILVIPFLSFQQVDKDDNSKVLAVVVDYVKEWDCRIINKMENYSFIEEVKMIKNNRDFKYLSDSTQSNSIFDLMENDTIQIEGTDFLYSETESTLNKRNKKRIKYLLPKSDLGQDNTIAFSTPIFSLDGQIALVWINTYCGSLCGSGEILILKKKNNEWVVVDRKLKSVS